MTFLKQFCSREEGATAIEYGLIAGLIAVVIISAVTLVGGNLTGTFNEIAANLRCPLRKADGAAAARSGWTPPQPPSPRPALSSRRP